MRLQAFQVFISIIFRGKQIGFNFYVRNISATFLQTAKIERIQSQLYESSVCLRIYVRLENISNKKWCHF